MRKTSLGQRARYLFDGVMARGTGALIAALALISVGFIVVVSLAVHATGIAAGGEDADPDFIDIFWRSLLRTLDPGTMGGDKGSPAFLLAMLAVTLGGIFIVGTLIGVLTTGIDAKLTELRRGRSAVLERDHTLILGWSPQIHTVIGELAAAGADKQARPIVVLGAKDKVEMEQEIRSRAGALGKTRVICRTGEPTELADLAIVDPGSARSIVVLPPPGEGDTFVIKVLLAVTNDRRGRMEPYHVVAPISDPANLHVARIAARGEAQLVAVDELISRITVQTCRQPGLSEVYTELLDFASDEIYLHDEPALVGSTFREAAARYEACAVLGIAATAGGVDLRPDADRRIAPGERIVAIAADHGALRIGGGQLPEIDESAIAVPVRVAPAPERTVVLGWNRKAPLVIRELDGYVAEGSDTLVVAEADAGDAIARLSAEARNHRLRFERGSTTDRTTLERLSILTADHIVVLSYSDSLSPAAADSQTLITLLHLRDMQERGGQDLSVVSEMLDVRNRDLAEVTHADDFIVGEHLATLLMCQLAENRHLESVFQELFDAAGSEIYLKPAASYVQLGRPVTFHTVSESAFRQGHLALGYRQSRAGGNGVVVNPRRSEPITFGADDRLIVLAEE